jgi:xylan 1,4-beta-xylosidase
LENHVRPFVELSFMPRKLAAVPIFQSFWYKPVVAPPKDWNKWADLVERFARHLVDRYGIAEVSHWYFEVWNEPNLDFWAGEPKEATYYRLYDETAKAIKKVDPQLRIGGPATAQAAWVDRFIEHVSENNIPIDFVSTHVYGNDLSEDVFGTLEAIPRNQFVCRAARKIHDQVRASSRPGLPILWSEYNASYKNEPEITDSDFMGPWLADTIRQCDGLAKMMSYWTFSDVFEEQGVVNQPFYGGFGLIAEYGLPKPAFNAFKVLHLLGSRRIETASQSALVTQRTDGAVVIAVWNLSLLGGVRNEKRVTLAIQNGGDFTRATTYRVDSAHGSLMGAFAAVGKPSNPSPSQIQILRKAAQLGPRETTRISNGKFTLLLPPNGLAVIELRPSI